MNVDSVAEGLSEVGIDRDEQQVGSGAWGAGAFPDKPTAGVQGPPLPSSVPEAGPEAVPEAVPKYQTRIMELFLAQQRELAQLQEVRSLAEERVARKQAELLALRRHNSRLDDDLAELQSCDRELGLVDGRERRLITQAYADAQQVDSLFLQQHQEREKLVENFTVRLNEIVDLMKAAPDHYEQSRLREDLEKSRGELHGREQELQALQSELTQLCQGPAARQLVQPADSFDVCADESLHLALRVIENDFNSAIEELEAKEIKTNKKAESYQQELNYAMTQHRALQRHT